MANILVVEDDMISAKMLRDFLTAQGHHTTVATNGESGLEAFHRNRPDLMIVDVALPRKNGFEVCFEVKRTDRGRDVPVILMSAVYTDVDHAQRYASEDLRAEDYLVKPFDLKHLAARVSQLLPQA